MIDYCKYCKHCKDDTKMNTDNMAIGMVIFGVPLPPTTEYIKVCGNHESSFYGDEINEYNSCVDFEEK